jgi:hypothetical protein
MAPSNSVPRILQQQPGGSGDPEQEQPESNELEQKPEGQQDEQEMGEGSYEGTREYNRRTQEYLKKADVEADAQAAKPRSQDEAREMKQAEDEGRSHSKGER